MFILNPTRPLEWCPIHVLCWFATLIALFLAENRGLAGEELVLAKFRGQNLRAVDITGVSDAESRTFVDKLGRDWTLERWPPPKFNLMRDIDETLWDPAPAATLHDFHLHLLRGALSNHVVDLVCDEIVRRCPNPGDRYHAQNLEDVVRIVADVRHRFDREMSIELSRGTTGVELARAIRVHFPDYGRSEQGAVETLMHYEMHRPYFLMRAHCCPSRINGTIPRWVYGDVRNASITAYLQAELRAKRQMYIDRLALRFGQVRMLLFRQVAEASLPGCEALGRELSTESGGVAGEGLQLARRTLTKLGSGTTVVLLEGRGDRLLGERLAGQVSPRTITAITATSAVYPVSRPELSAAWKADVATKDSERFGFLYDVVTESVLRPIAREILSQMESVSVPLPSEEDLVGSVGRGSLPPVLLGAKLPVVFSPETE